MAFSADPTAQPYVVEDCRGVLQLLSDGTVVRSAALPFPVDGNVAYNDHGRVEWKDAGDLLRDKNVEYAERLKAAQGKGNDDVELVVFAGEEHAFFGVKPTSGATGELVRVIRRFMATETEAAC
ncbi:unnamed protein product [Triticum turgidum subsp. durum]|uniref:Alpha/beta hydrolase fold-3 domain-containing protein n=1 Tax=Triticum turgidum subsp. durum TaxID=4567 RepID=A0A9R1A7V7_TRITD|nr:unnamed protein product [Triticum turgidum subsp. durum]